MPVTRAIHIIGNDRGHGPDDDDRDIDRRMGRGRGDGTQGRRRSGRSRVEAGSRSEPGLRLPLADVREEGTHTSASTAYTAAAAKHHSRAEQVALQQQREDANREERSRGVLQRLHKLAVHGPERVRAALRCFRDIHERQHRVEVADHTSQPLVVAERVRLGDEHLACARMTPEEGAPQGQ